MIKKVISLINILVLFFLSSCNYYKDNPTPSHFDNKTEYAFSETFSYEKFELRKDNYGIHKKDHPFRSHKKNYYLIFSLDDGSLAYVFYEYLPYTGITFAPKEIFIYPSDDIDKSFYKRILKKDYPEVLLEKIREEEPL